MDINQTTDGGSGLDLLAGDDSSINDSQSANEGSERGSSTNEQTNKNNDSSKEGSNEQTNDASNSKAEVQKEGKENQVEKGGQPPKEKFVSRSEKREQEIKTLLAELKREREEFKRERSQGFQSQTNGQPANQNGQQQSEPVFVEPPKKPELSREEIAKHRADALAADRADVVQLADEALRQWDKYETDLKFWKLENGQHVNKFNEARKQNWIKAVTKLPDLSNKDSELYKEAQILAQKLPEVLHRRTADGELLIAELAAMRLERKNHALERKNHASELGALKEQIKKLTDQLNSTQKRIQPAVQKTTPKLSNTGDGTPEERLARKLEVAGMT